MKKVGLRYRSAHTFRHGHAVYAIKQAQNVADLKAVSQNLMHANLSITDGVYGILSSDDVGERIQGLGNQTGNGAKSKSEIIEQITQLINEL